MKKIEAYLSKLTSIVSIISYAGIFMIMVLIVVDVFVRFIIGTTIVGAYEIVERLLFCSVFASFAYAQSHKGHVHVTMLVSLFPAKVRMFFLGLTGIFSVVICFVLAYAASLQAIQAFVSNYTTGVLKIKLFPFYWVEFVAMIVLGLAVLYDSLKCFVGISNQEISNEVDDSMGISQIKM
ncbi:MAG: TRAP transporter small permease [Sedimentibacter sp.]